MAGKIGFDEQEILSVAMRVFWEKGYNNTSTTDLLEAMNIRRSSMYNTYGDKYNLFLRCLLHYSDYVFAIYQGISAGSASAMAAIDEIIDMGAKVATGGDLSCFAIKASFELPVADAGVNHLLHQDQGRIIALIADLLKKAADENEVSGNYDPFFLAHYIYGQFPGWCRLYVTTKDVALIGKMVAHVKVVVRM